MTVSSAPPSPAENGKQKGPPALAWVLLLALTMAWGSMWPLMKITVTEIPIFTLRGSMALLAGIVLFAVAALLGRGLRPIHGEFPKILLCGCFTILIWFTLSAVALMLLPAGRAALLAYTMPFFAFVIGVLIFKEPIALRRVAGVVCSLGAVLALGWEDITGLLFRTEGVPWGLIVILSASLTWAVGSTMQTRFAIKTPTTVMAAWMLVASGIPLLAIGVTTEPYDWLKTVSHEAIGAYFVVCLVSTAFGFWCWSMILKLTPLAFASIAVLSVPMMSQVLSFVVLGEAFGLQELLGLVLITAGLLTILPLDGLRAYLFRK